MDNITAGNMTPAQAAIEYAKNYEGDFGFMKDMRAKVRDGQTLSVNMILAIGRCMERDQRVAQAASHVDQYGAPRARNETTIDLNVLPEGRLYAAVDGTEQTEFLKFDRIKSDAQRWAGWTFVKRQYGENWDRLGSQRPGKTYVGGGTKLIEQVLADPFKAAQRYGIEIGKCGMCNKALTDEDSRNRGIGPECWARKFGKGPSHKMDKELGIRPASVARAEYAHSLASALNDPWSRYGTPEHEQWLIEMEADDERWSGYGRSF
jgi:hypothetical protein